MNLAAQGTINRGVRNVDPLLALAALPQNYNPGSGMNGIAGLLAQNMPQEAAEYRRGLLSMPMPMGVEGTAQAAPQAPPAALQGIADQAQAARGSMADDAAARDQLIQQARGLYQQAQPWQQYDLSGRNINTWQTKGGALVDMLDANPWLESELQQFAPSGHSAIDPRFRQFAGGSQQQAGMAAPFPGLSLTSMPQGRDVMERPTRK